MVLGYLPPDQSVWEETLKRKRTEYYQLREKMSTKLSHIITQPHLIAEHDMKSYKQILVDVPRTMTDIKDSTRFQKLLINILFAWSVRHPASGYVQGINDLCIPLINAFAPKGDINGISDEDLNSLEADVFWCLTAILDRIQNVYTNSASYALKKLETFIISKDEKFDKFLKENELDYVKFAFRWFNCIFVREFSLKQILRIWDTYIAEEEGFSTFHIYTCAALLLNVKPELHIRKDFAERMIFLQKLPTDTWSNERISMLLSEAYQYMMMYEKTNHIKIKL